MGGALHVCHVQYVCINDMYIQGVGVRFIAEKTGSDWSHPPERRQTELKHPESREVVSPSAMAGSLRQSDRRCVSLEENTGKIETSRSEGLAVHRFGQKT